MQQFVIIPKNFRSLQYAINLFLDLVNKNNDIILDIDNTLTFEDKEKYYNNINTKIIVINEENIIIKDERLSLKNDHLSLKNDRLG